MSEPVFLTAEWRWLAMLNYVVDRRLLAPHVPAGTELDEWRGETLISLVGFRFLNTRLLGIPIPGHRDFEEVNLRFYVRRRTAEGWRRGVVFLREIVPRAAVSFVANTIYHERYVTRPMRHAIVPPDQDQPHGVVQYHWRTGASWASLRVDIAGTPESPEPGSEAEFITEHYWGYTRRRDGSTAEYGVEHPAWRVWPGRDSTFHGDVGSLYGREFTAILTGERPCSALVAEGSPIVVRRGVICR